MLGSNGAGKTTLFKAVAGDLGARPLLPLPLVERIGRTALVVGTFDTKGDELRFIRDRLRECGVHVRTVDLSTSGKPSRADVTPGQVAAMHPRGSGCGCDAVVVTTREDFAAAVRRLTSGRGADVVFDAVGRDTFERSVESLAPRGHLVSFGQASGDVGAQSIDRLAVRSITLSRPNYVHYTDTSGKIALQSGRLFAALAGAVAVPRPRTYPLAEAAAAHADLESRRTTGSLVLIP